MQWREPKNLLEAILNEDERSFLFFSLKSLK